MNNSQKIFDIMPPQKKGASIEKNRPQKTKIEDSGGAKKKSSGFFKNFFIFLVFLLVIFFAVSHFVINKAKVQVWLKTEPVDLNEKITVSTSEDSINISSMTIPGQVFNEEKTISQEFEASGVAEEGARAIGKIRVYNNYSDSPQALVKNTRLISAEGKLFKTTERIVVPGGTYEKGKLQPSYADVNVIADQPGESYNIGPTTFSIPGFLGTPKYTAFYGKSSESMIGGDLGQSKQITKEDLDKAKEDLTKQAKEEGKSALEEKIPGGFVLLDDAIFSEIIEATSSLSVGAKVKTFFYQVKIKLSAISFKKSDIEGFSKELIIFKYPDNKKIENDSLNISWENNSVESGASRLVLNTNIKADIYSNINDEELKNSLMGKSLTEAQEIILNNQEVIKVQINSWPFWASAIPDNLEKIMVEFILD